MLSVAEARAMAIAELRAARVRVQLAQALRETLPGVAVTIEGTRIVLEGRLDVDDPRLRWSGSLLR